MQRRMNWPPEQTCKYEFKEKEELEIEIPLIANMKNIRKAKTNRPEGGER